MGLNIFIKFFGNCFRIFQELAEGPLLSYDPLPPTNSIDLYKKSSRNASNVFDDPSAFRMFFRLADFTFLAVLNFKITFCRFNSET